LHTSNMPRRYFNHVIIDFLRRCPFCSQTTFPSAKQIQKSSKNHCRRFRYTLLDRENSHSKTDFRVQANPRSAGLPDHELDPCRRYISCTLPSTGWKSRRAMTWREKSNRRSTTVCREFSHRINGCVSPSLSNSVDLCNPRIPVIGAFQHRDTKRLPA
jgi:hypothetical protein